MEYINYTDYLTSIPKDRIYTTEEIILEFINVILAFPRFMLKNKLKIVFGGTIRKKKK